MKKLSILDCTLRDGGYINNWNFGQKTAICLVQALCNARVEFVEVGFISTDTEFSGVNSSVYNDFSGFGVFDSVNLNGSELVGMIAYGKYPEARIPPAYESPLKYLRVIFKKKQSEEALDYCRKLIEKGYYVFVNPTHTYDYSDLELLSLISKVNDLKPFGFSVVDTLGILQEKQLLHMFSVIDFNLDPDIVLGFHSHNNLQLSFSNSVALINARSNRRIVIDSSLSGMGRGAGNLCTELILKHLNDNEGFSYNMTPIYEAVDNYIKPIFEKKSWGYSLPYFLAASNVCHPNYALYLSNLGTVSFSTIDRLMQMIPFEKTRNYDEKFISELYFREQSANEIDEISSLEKLSNCLKGRKILLVGPGPSILLEKDKISRFIEENSPVVISVNFEPSMLRADFVFVSNEKRYGQLSFVDGSRLIVTSNLTDPKNMRSPNLSALEGAPGFEFNYRLHLNPVSRKDNAAIMLIDILVKARISDIFMAGFDGYDQNQNNFFTADLNIVTYDSDMLTTFSNSNRNREWSENICYYRDHGVNVNYITSTLYS
jgi:4-hydroxy 2-oxovalerate aldolase